MNSEVNLKVDRHFGRNEDKNSYIGTYYIKDTEKFNCIANFKILNIDWVCRIATVQLELYRNSIKDENISMNIHKIIKAMVDYMYNNLNLLKIKTKLYSNDEDMIISYQEFGFEIEGFLKNELFVNGEYYNLIYLALFKEGYNENIITSKFEKSISEENNDEIKKENKGLGQISINKATDLSVLHIKKLGALFNIEGEKNK